MENKTDRFLFTIIFLGLALLSVFSFTYLMVAYVAPAVRGRRRKNKIQNMNNQNKNTVVQPSCELNSPQTQFFKDSVKKAEEVLMGNVYLDGYKYGSPVDLTKLNAETKNQIVVAMNFMMIDPIASRTMEDKFRLIVEQENVPLWFVILHEAIKKLIPIEHNPSVSELSNEALMAEIERRNLKHTSDDSKVVSINKVA